MNLALEDAWSLTLAAGRILGAAAADCDNGSRRGSFGGVSESESGVGFGEALRKWQA